MVLENLISKLVLETTLSKAETEKKTHFGEFCCLNHGKYMNIYHQEITEFLFNVIAL